MGDYEQELQQARQACADRDWPTAAEHYGMVPSTQLTADDLVALGQAEWYLGHFAESTRANTAAYEALVADARPADATGPAVLNTYLYLSRGDAHQGMGWAGRAGELLATIPEGPAHGPFIFLTEVLPNVKGPGEPALAVDAARRVHELGRQHDDPTLLAQGLTGEGMALLKVGQVIDGLKKLDEAMVAIQHKAIPPMWTGQVYCYTVEVLFEVRDFGRMARWTEVTEDWLATQSADLWHEGFCRMYRAYLQLLHGDWDGAERGALQAVEELGRDLLPYCAQAWHLVGDIRRRRGDPSAADAYDEAHARGRDPQPGRALLMLQGGDARGAAVAVRSALAAAGSDPLRRAPICAAAVEINLAAGDTEAAEAAESELATTAERYGTSGLQALAASAKGMRLLAEGQAEQALPVLRDSCRRWLELGAQHDAAGACVQLAEAYRALGDETSAEAEVALAKEAYERLGMAWPSPEAAAPGGLTERECDVLALVADGRTNRQIGEELFISERTVGRHLTNIYRKIDATSRTQAARYALEHGVTSTG